MNNRLLWLLVLVVLSACDKAPSLIKEQGQTMGTYYSISYYHTTSLQNGVDSVLKEFNQSFSTYIPNSSISKINQCDSTVLIEDKLFNEFYPYAQGIAKLTEGYFDYTVMPLVNYYGFGYHQDTTQSLEELKRLVSYEKFGFYKEGKGVHYRKESPQSELDFSAIAKGYGVDVVAAYLQKRGVKSMLVDIGGELKSIGLKPEGKKWTVGVEQPEKGNHQRKIMQALQLENKSIATSGNYRNYKESDGAELVHTINPKTGEAFKNDLLSVSVVASECYMADGLATALMAMGYVKADEFLVTNNYIKAMLVYYENETIKSKFYNGLETSIVKN